MLLFFIVHIKMIGQFTGFVKRPQFNFYAVYRKHFVRHFLVDQFLVTPQLTQR